MKYKLINEELNNKLNELPLEEIILQNRGILDPQHYLNLTNADLYSYTLLDNIDKAVECLLKHIENNNKIVILSDPDCDGICASSILYQYLKELQPNIDLDTLLHVGKGHGLDDSSISIPEDTKLLLVPDAGSNDVKECKLLQLQGIDVVCLDHHEKSKDNPYAIIVNPQFDNYPNKELSGCAVTYKFLQALDNETWNESADKYLDLVALSIISDSMDIRSFESKRLIDLGLSSIRNKAFKSIIEKQNYSINGIINIQNVQFYIAPLINASIRSGTQEEKEVMFQAFCQIDQEFDYTKRGEKESVKEDIYSHMARMATNSRARQNREIDKGLEIINKDIIKHNRNNNKILFANSSELDNNFTGLVAMRLASQYSKPCILIRETAKKNGYYAGSMRNFNGSPIKDLKTFLEDTKLFDFIQGHQFAAGVGLKKENIAKVILETNKLLQDVDFDKYYNVDFIFEPQDITIELVEKIDKLKNMWGNNVDEPLILIKNIHLNTNNIDRLGANKDTLKLLIKEEDDIQISAIKFKCLSDEPLMEKIENNPIGIDIKLNIICKLSMNIFNSISQPQANIIDYSLE